MAPVEPWERIWIDAETFSNDTHSRFTCMECHNGQPIDDMEAAHEGLIARPSRDAQTFCGGCHEEITESAANSLHTTLRGYDTVLYERSLPENHTAIETMESYHCDNCHTSCGDCHVSQPANVGGGLVEGHVFRETPSMARQCTACHGSRVKDEYYGAHEGITSDVHYRERMPCTDCHSGAELHGTGMDANHRYDGEAEPSCESCHQETTNPATTQVESHAIHQDELSCQVCHSVAYVNCSNCHVERNEDDIPFFSVEENWIGFYIGQNAAQSEERPWSYVPVRHVPIDPNSFSFYGENLLSNFDARPTWAYATPHNIQRITPQNEHCENCHGNDALFLTLDKVEEAERAANADVIVEGAPPPVSEE